MSELLALLVPLVTVLGVHTVMLVNILRTLQDIRVVMERIATHAEELARRD